MSKNALVAVEVKNLSKTYSEGWFRRRKLSALTNVTLSVKSGEIFGLLGPNGAGKTTLLKILLGIISKTSGEASLLGMPAGSRESRISVGYLPEHLRMPGHHTVLSAMDLYGSLSNLPRATIRERRDRIIDLVGLKGREREPIKKFSKGMLQRLGLGQALLAEPKMLILDEPTDGLDPRGRAEMRDLISELKKRGVTIFLNSHILQEVELICERVAILDRGILKYCGEVRDVAESVRQQTSEGQVEFTLMGDVNRMRDSLSAFDTVRINRLAEDKLEALMNVPDQGKVDQLVDALRKNGISLVAIKPIRASLEDAFLAIVEPESKSNHSASSSGYPIQ